MGAPAKVSSRLKIRIEQTREVSGYLWQKGWAERNAGKQFAEHQWQAEARSQGGGQLRRHDHDRDAQQDLE